MTDQNFINISKNTSVENIKDWKLENSCFRISRSSSFALFAEEFAMGKLNSIIKQKIWIEFTYDPLKDDLEEFVRSFFCLNLIWNAEQIIYDEIDIKLKLVEHIWKIITENRGLVGSGKLHNIISRDPDYSIPNILRDSEATSFPHFDTFKRVFKSSGVSILGEGIFYGSRTENDVVSYLYESTKNSFEHGRTDNDGYSLNGFRGVSIRKIILNLNQLNIRSDIPEFFKKYISELVNNSKMSMESPGTGKLISASVVDTGIGIHKTLPKLVEDESEIEILVRSFKEGETRKPSSSAIEPGHGLSNIVNASQYLDAYLLVMSGKYIGGFDFSKKDTVISSSRFKETSRDQGTSLTIIWPPKKGGGDQIPLFGDS